MAIEMPESTEQGFLSSHPTSVERFLAMERVAELREYFEIRQIDQRPKEKEG